MVHCAPWQAGLRNDVRNTWGNRHLGVAAKVVFVVGRSEEYREVLGGQRFSSNMYSTGCQWA